MTVRSVHINLHQRDRWCIPHRAPVSKRMVHLLFAQIVQISTGTYVCDLAEHPSSRLVKSNARRIKASPILLRISTATSCTSKMRSTFFAAFLALPFLAQAALNGACVNGRTGVCITTASCKSAGGKSYPGSAGKWHCPNDPDNVQCCVKSCGSGGICRTVNSCNTGNTKSGTLISSFPRRSYSCLTSYTLRSLPRQRQRQVLSPQEDHSSSCYLPGHQAHPGSGRG